MIYRLIHADVMDGLAQIADGSVQTVVTSPPYWGLRDYGVAGQIGLESTPDEFVARLVSVFREVRRVLADDGTLWLNIGDSYAATSKGSGGTDKGTIAGGAGQATNAGSFYAARFDLDAMGLKQKDLCGVPWMLAFALRADGWYLRSDIIWHKPNPMPESVTDRPTKAHEYLFLLTKNARYYYDGDAVREPYNEASLGRYGYEFQGTAPNCNTPGGDIGRRERERGERPPNPLGRNRRSVWTITTESFKEAHFATFPQALVEPCILAGSRIGDTVLDPFNGSGTTGVVALSHQRNYVGIELNADYVAMARRRLAGVAPMFAKETA